MGSRLESPVQQLNYKFQGNGSRVSPPCTSVQVATEEFMDLGRLGQTWAPYEKPRECVVLVNVYCEGIGKQELAINRDSLLLVSCGVSLVTSTHVPSSYYL